MVSVGVREQDFSVPSVIPWHLISRVLCAYECLMLERRIILLTFLLLSAVRVLATSPPPEVRRGTSPLPKAVGCRSSASSGRPPSTRRTAGGGPPGHFPAYKLVSIARDVRTAPVWLQSQVQ